MEQEQGYYMVIPATVWNSDLTERSILLYGHISTLVKKEGYCWASNDYFVTKLKCSVASVKRCIIELEKAKLIYRELIFKEGTKEVESRKIYLNPGRFTGEPTGRSNYEDDDLNPAIVTGDYTQNDENDENLGRFTGDPDNSTRVLLDSTNIEDNKEEIKVSYSSYSSTPRTEETEDLISKYSNKSIFEKDSISFNEALSASEKELGKRIGCKPLEYIPTDQERWAEEQEGIAREECESFLNTLLEIWNGVIQDKEDCLFQIFKLSELSRLEAEVALKGRVKLNNWLLAGKTLNTIDDFLKHQVKKSEDEWLGIL